MVLKFLILDVEHVFEQTGLAGELAISYFSNTARAHPNSQIAAPMGGKLLLQVLGSCKMLNNDMRLLKVKLWQ